MYCQEKFTFQSGDIQIWYSGFIPAFSSTFTFQSGDIQINTKN